MCGVQSPAGMPTTLPVESVAGIEPATSTLARWHSTIELHRRGEDTNLTSLSSGQVRWVGFEPTSPEFTAPVPVANWATHLKYTASQGVDPCYTALEAASLAEGLAMWTSGLSA